MSFSDHSTTNGAPLPPGLELDATGDIDAPTAALVDQARREMIHVSMESVHKKLADLQLEGGEDLHATVDAVRKLVLDDVEKRVQEKADELWLKGKQMLTAMQTKHHAKNLELSELVTECHKKQHALEAENEKLKQVLADLAGRFTALGMVFGNMQNGGAPHHALAGAKRTAQNGCAADAALTPVAGSTHIDAAELHSPGPATPGPESAVKEADVGVPPGLPEMPDLGAPPSLPEVPSFPFPAPTNAPTPFLLSEALGSQKAQKTQLSLAESLAPASIGALPPQSGAVPFTFSFTLRKADGAELGLNVSHTAEDRVLRVEGIRAEGAMEAWNRQCLGSAFAEKVVLPGDHIVSVNGVAHDSEKMLEECRDRQLLKLTVVRNYSAPVAPSSRPTTLRAEASVFVPMASSMPEEASGTENTLAAEALEVK